MRDPQRTIPLGLITAMVLAAVLYIAVSITVVSVVAWQELSEAPGPITEVISQTAARNPTNLVHGDHAIRGREYGARQLRHDIAPALRHGTAKIASGSLRQSAP